MRRTCTAIGLVALLHLTGAAAHAQTGTAALVGDVSDSQKQVIPGAIVTATHVATAASQNTITDERGNFRFGNLQPGVYTLKVELPGFKTAVVERINAQVDTVTREAITLEVGGIAETVSVVSETTHLNTSDASVGNVMSREQIRSLPVEAQNVVHLLSLQPGAIFIPTSNPATVD
ncbi:MAG TPA: carboxypeptidase-like regulatory domain-containing protein, partial [Vicinamibacterales bacterium]